MALITNMPRTATATARTDCRLIALDNRQLQQALQVAPEFALMLMSIMIIRLRETIAHLNAHGALSNNDDLKDSAVFDKKMLDKLEQELDSSSHIRYPAGKVIIQEGQAGIFMYIVLEGSVTIAIQNHILGKIGQGGMFGEMALIERTSGRMASATSKTNCVLLAINRNVFLDLVRANPRFVMSLLSAVGNRARYMASRLA
jgi:CRP-like cAMP-binding protein